MSIPYKDCLKKLIQVAFRYSMPDLKDEKNYIELFNMVKMVRFEKPKINLLILLYEQFFIEKIYFKKLSDDCKMNDYTNFCNNLTNYPQEAQKDPLFQFLKKFLKFKIFDEAVLGIIYYIINENDSNLLIFKAFEAVLSAKNKYLISNPSINIDTQLNKFTFLYKVMYFFDNETNDDDSLEYFILEFENNNIIKKQLENKQFEEYLKRKEVDSNFILRFINKNAEKAVII